MSIKVAFLFPGQGSQQVGMGEDFYNNSQVAKELVEAASDRLKIDFKELLFKENDLLSKTEYTQPAIFLVSLIAHKLFEDELPIKPHFALGHSLGEVSAIGALKGVDIIDGVELVHIRGKEMAKACEGKDVGMMVVLGLDDEKVEAITKKAQEEGKSVWAVNYNTVGQIVIAGIKEDLISIESPLKEAGAKRVMLLNMSVASHCPLLNSAKEPFKEVLESYLKDEFISDVISNVTAKKYHTKSEALELLPKQLVMPVLYKQSILNYDNEVDCYIEFGHGAILKGLNRKLTKKPHINISDMKSLEEGIKKIEELSK
ncbi:MAG: ACP S-malonyltransferase [Epsilonproteobacteria bacterium]|nr:ACP S-malonyltransferase [Campylobacterota bacterium]